MTTAPQQPQTWYCVSNFRWSPLALTVRQVKVVRSTAASVWIERSEAPNKPWRTNRISDWEHYYPTLFEAESFIEQSLLRSIEQCESRIRRDTDDLAKKQERLKTFRQDLQNQFREEQ